MGYKHLEKFKRVIGLESYDNVCDNIPMFLKEVLYPTIKFDQVCSNFLTLLDEFYVDFGINDLDDFIIAYNILNENFLRLKNRSNFSKGYARKFKKIVVDAFLKIDKGFSKIFDYKAFTQIKVSDEIIRRYILDNQVGFGRKYRFNVDFVKVLNKFCGNELIAVFRLFQEPKYNKKPNGWNALGTGSEPRILLDDRIFKKKVYFLFPISRHKDYDKILNSDRRPESFPFEKFIP